MQRATAHIANRTVQKIVLEPCCSGRPKMRGPGWGLMPPQMTWRANQCLVSNGSEQVDDHDKCYQEELMPYTNDGMRCRAQHYLPPRPVTPVNAAIGRRPQLLHR